MTKLADMTVEQLNHLQMLIKGELKRRRKRGLSLDTVIERMRTRSFYIHVGAVGGYRRIQAQAEGPASADRDRHRRLSLRGDQRPRREEGRPSGGRVSDQRLDRVRSARWLHVLQATQADRLRGGDEEEQPD